MQTTAVIKHLICACNCHLLSEISSAPQDIDVYVPLSEFPKVHKFLGGEGYVLTSENTFQSVYRKYENGNLFILDLISDFNVYTQLLPSVKLSAEGNKQLGQSMELSRCFKYFCYRRTDKIPYLEEHQDAFGKFLENKNNFQLISLKVRQAARSAVQKLFGSLRKSHPIFSFKSQSYLQVGAPWLNLRWKLLGTGYSIAFVGPDGSGKSFFIEKLRPIGVTKTLYMGDWFFYFQKLYKLLLRIPSPFNRFLYLFYGIENYGRVVKVFFWRLLGRIVLIDRFPGTNRNIITPGILASLNQFIFNIFPKPDLIVLLYAPPHVIHKRKQELSLVEIKKIQEKLKTLLSNTKHIIVNTEQLDESLNLLLAHVYRRLNPK